MYGSEAGSTVEVTRRVLITSSIWAGEKRHGEESSLGEGCYLSQETNDFGESAKRFCDDRGVSAGFG